MVAGGAERLEGLATGYDVKTTDVHGLGEFLEVTSLQM